MVKLRESAVLQRKIRQEDVKELVIPTWTLAREAIREGRTDEALELLDYGCTEAMSMHDIMVSLVDECVTYIANKFGEEKVPEVFALFRDGASDWLSKTPDVEQTIQRCIEFQRAHFGDATVKEEADRYVLRYDPCGSGGRLRRTKSTGVTKKPYLWSWSKTGVPYYCIHCCILWEMAPIDLRGYPIRIVEIGDRPEDPCIQLLYKRPELIPEKYFTRVGMKKDVSRFAVPK